jgi:hypothetical protein
MIYILAPNHIFLVLAYFIIWWTGLEICQYFLLGTFHYKTLIIYYFLAFIITGTVSAAQYKISHKIEIGIYPFLVLRHYVFGFIILLTVIYLPKLVNGLVKIIEPFKIVAPISYAIYVIHYPIAVQTNFSHSIYINILLKIILIVGIAYLIEIVLQPKINKLLR